MGKALLWQRLLTVTLWSPKNTGRYTDSTWSVVTLATGQNCPMPRLPPGSCCISPERSVPKFLLLGLGLAAKGPCCPVGELKMHKHCPQGSHRDHRSLVWPSQDWVHLDYFLLLLSFLHLWCRWRQHLAFLSLSRHLIKKVTSQTGSSTNRLHSCQGINKTGLRCDFCCLMEPALQWLFSGTFRSVCWQITEKRELKFT